MQAYSYFCFPFFDFYLISIDSNFTVNIYIAGLFIYYLFNYYLLLFEGLVLADGRVIGTAGKTARSRKNVAGYNLTNLLVGSEGTLGVITKISLKLYPQPESTISAVSPFPDVASAIKTAVQIM